jgi:hypothetical protein
MVEGRLAQEWVAEAECAWASIAPVRGKKHVVINLCDVSFVDREGEKFLEKVCAAGAILIGADPMMRTLIEEIKQRAPYRPSSRALANVLTVVFFFLLLTTFAVACQAASAGREEPQQEQQASLQAQAAHGSNRQVAIVPRHM